MKKVLLNVVIITLLVSACSSAKTTEEETSVATEAPASSAVVVKSSTEVTDTSAVAEVSSADQPSGEAEDAATSTEATEGSQPTDTPSPTDTPQPTDTPTATETPAIEMTAEPTTETTASTEPPLAPSAQPAQTMPMNQARASQSAQLERIPDTDPAPPLTILVSTIRIEENGYYKLTGTVRNDSSDTYGGVAVVATFYEKATPCTEHTITRRRPDGSEETVTVEDCDYNWHGPVKVYAPCPLLEPGAECPFSLEIYPQDYVSYMLHPEGTPVEHRQPASLVLSNLNVSNDGIGNVRIMGTATNENPFVVRNANIAGTLVDAAGQIVSVGSIIVPGEIAPGASISFDLRIEYEPYARYQLSAQATQN